MNMTRPPEGLEPILLILLGVGFVLFLATAFLAHRTARFSSSGRAARGLGALSTACLVLAGLSIAVLVLEVTFRLFVPGGYFAFTPVEATESGALIERLPDGQTWWEYRNSLGFDEFGYRGEFVPYDPGAFRVVVLGDSVTYGVSVDYKDTFVRRIQSALEERCSAVSLYNIAVSGYSTLQERIAFERKGLSLKPHLVLLGVVTNDLAQFTIIGDTAYDIRLKEKAGVPIFSFLPIPDGVNRFLVVNSVLYQFLTLRGVAVADRIEGLPGKRLDAAVQDFELLRREVQGAGARLAIVLFPMLDESIKEEEQYETAFFYGTVRQWAASTGVSVIDPRSRLAQLPTEHISNDGCCHLSETGHEVVAEVMLEVLEREGLFEGCR